MTKNYRAIKVTKSFLDIILKLNQLKIYDENRI